MGRSCQRAESIPGFLVNHRTFLNVASPLALGFAILYVCPTVHSVPPQRTAQELHRLQQLREFCNQSYSMEKQFDFAIQTLRDRRDYWNSSTANPKHVTINLGTIENPTLYDPYSKNPRSQTNPLVDWKNRQIQNLRDRNFGYFEKIFSDVTKYGPEEPSIWNTVQVKHDQLAQIIRSGDFQGCVAELDNVLPTKVKKGGRQ
jgi:hypothetical protein